MFLSALKLKPQSIYLVKREKFVCAQSYYKSRIHDCTDYQQNTMQHPRNLDRTECKHANRHLNGTDNPQLNAFNCSKSFTFFDDIQKQPLLETNDLLSVSHNLTLFTMVLSLVNKLPTCFKLNS